MESRRNLTKDREFQQDRLKVLLVLALEAAALAGPEVEAQVAEKKGCPSPEELAALSERRLEGQERSEILSHIDRCPDCFRQWVAVGRTRSSQGARGG